MRAGCREISLLHWQGPLGESSRYFQIWPGDFIKAQHRSRGGAGVLAAVLLCCCATVRTVYSCTPWPLYCTAVRVVRARTVAAVLCALCSVLAAAWLCPACCVLPLRPPTAVARSGDRADDAVAVAPREQDVGHALATR
jgi:hypothetical protein